MKKTCYMSLSQKFKKINSKKKLPEKVKTTHVNTVNTRYDCLFMWHVSLFFLHLLYLSPLSRSLFRVYIIVSYSTLSHFQISNSQL